MVVVREGLEEMVNLLLAHLTNIETADAAERDAVSLAKYSGHHDIVELLQGHRSRLETSKDERWQSMGFDS